MKKKIIAIGIIGMFLASAISAVTVSASKKMIEDKNIQSLDDFIVIPIGKMTIIDEECNIELYQGTEIFIDGVTIEDQYTHKYKFVVEYKMVESDWSFGQGKWTFKILYEGQVYGQSRDVRVIYDTWNIKDQEEGELYVNGLLHGIWYDEAFNDKARIDLICIYEEDLFWGGNYTRIDRAAEELKISTCLPAPHIKLVPDDGTDFGSVKPRRSVTKTFTLENNVPKEVFGDLIISPWDSDFKITSWEYFSLESGKRQKITVEFTPKSVGAHSAKLIADAHKSFPEEYKDSLIITGGCSRSRTRDMIYPQFLEKFPIFERLFSVPIFTRLINLL